MTPQSRSDSSTDEYPIPWLRRVRDAHAASLAGKSDTEVITFYAEAAERAREEARQWRGR